MGSREEKHTSSARPCPGGSLRALDKGACLHPHCRPPAGTSLLCLLLSSWFLLSHYLSLLRFRRGNDRWRWLPDAQWGRLIWWRTETNHRFRRTKEQRFQSVFHHDPSNRPSFLFPKPLKDRTRQHRASSGYRIFTGEPKLLVTGYLQNYLKQLKDYKRLWLVR